MPTETFQSKVTWAKEGVLSTASIRGKEVLVDEPGNLGGTDKGPNPGEYILAALGGCINVLVVSFADQFDVQVKDVDIQVEGDINLVGFLVKDAKGSTGYE